MQIKFFTSLLVILILVGCATVRQQDLDAWAGMPVEALETHSFFITVPVFKTKTKSGIEIWNYANGGDISSCYANANAYGNDGYVNASGYETCRTVKVVCNNIFYIKDDIVLEYKPTGSCYTKAFLQPEARYKRLTGNKT